MGPSYTYFRATDDQAASALLPGRTEPPEATSPVTVSVVDPTIVLGHLESVLTGRPYDVVTENFRWSESIAVAPSGSPRITAVTDGVELALVDTHDEELPGAVSRWIEAAGLDADSDELLVVVQRLKALAVEAREVGESLYCWAHV